jgi:hypothetical protein
MFQELFIMQVEEEQIILEHTEHHLQLQLELEEMAVVQLEVLVQTALGQEMEQQILVAAVVEDRHTFILAEQAAQV